MLRWGKNQTQLGTMNKTISAVLASGILAGCIANPLGAGSTLNLYTWHDRTTPFETRIAPENTDFNGYYDGDVGLSDLLELFPQLARSPNLPYLAEICDVNICYYAVFFGSDFIVAENGKIGGLGVLSEISTALYQEVKNLDADAVRAVLDQRALELITGDVNLDGVTDYSDISRLDYRRVAAHHDLLLDPELPARLAEAMAGDGDGDPGTGGDEDPGTGEGEDPGTGSGEDPGTGGGEDPGTGGDEDPAPQQKLLTAWMLNETAARSQFIYESNSNQGVLVNVQSVAPEGDDYVRVAATGVPDYAVTITEELLAWLNSRPQASSDFISGAASVAPGQVVRFGEDIGYVSSNECTAGAGFGYWPPGPGCPENANHSIILPLVPTATTTECATGAGSVGYYVNGTSVFNWTDAQTYNNEGVWQTLAPSAEVYDVDICGGHAAQGEYHHHFYSECLAELVGDTGESHSPLYGYAADGFPIYGPWQSAGELALSAWRRRNYDDTRDPTGCGQAGSRTCLLVDQYDPDLGTVAASSAGPDTDGSYTSLSGNQFDTQSGFFFEDWYWDASLSLQGGAYLDQYNGHADDERAYHYHVTIEIDASGAAIPAFPYSVGPRFAGELQGQTNASCSAGGVPGGGPGGGPGGEPGGEPPEDGSAPPDDGAPPPPEEGMPPTPGG